MIPKVARFMVGGIIIVVMLMAYVSMLMAFGAIINDDLSLAEDMALALLGLLALTGMGTCYSLLLKMFEPNDEQS